MTKTDITIQAHASQTKPDTTDTVNCNLKEVFGNLRLLHDHLDAIYSKLTGPFLETVNAYDLDTMSVLEICRLLVTMSESAQGKARQIYEKM